LKKKDKKKFVRENLRISNVEINDVEDFYANEIVNDKRADKKTMKKGEKSFKSDMDIKIGRIIEIKSNHVCVVDVDGKSFPCFIGGRFKGVNLETRSILATGDLVNVDFSGEPRVEEILPRNNAVSRYTDDSFQFEIIIAANVDQAIITSSYISPDIRYGLIDRYICAAAIQNLHIILCINKIDLAQDIMEFMENELAFYKKNKIKVVLTSAKNLTGIEELKNLLKNRISVFTGHSGAGKTSLINCLQPDLNLKVMDVSDYSGKGTHTTSRSKLFKWDFGGYLIDTPGIKTFGLHNKDKELIPRVFPGINKLFNKCRFHNCTHSHEEDCAVKKAVEKGKFPYERYESYLRIFESLSDKNY